MSYQGRRTHSDFFSYSGSNRDFTGELGKETTVFADKLADRDQVESFLDNYEESISTDTDRDYLRVSGRPADNFFQDADAKVEYSGETVHLGKVDWTELKQNLEQEGIKTTREV